MASKKVIRNPDGITKYNPFSSLNPDVNAKQIQELSQKVYDSGHEVEATVILHGWIENYLNLLWQGWCTNDSISKEEHEIKVKSYLDAMNVLYEIGLIDEQDKQQLTDFNSLRNSLSHNMFGVKRKKIGKHQIKTDFKKGMACAGLMPALFTKEIFVLSERHNKFKSQVFKKIRKQTGKI